MSVKGSEVPEFICGFEHAREGGKFLEHKSRPWKRGFRAYELQASCRVRFQDREWFLQAA